MTQPDEKDFYLSTDTTVFTLVELADYDSQRFYKFMEPLWNERGFELAKNELPPDYKFNNYDFTLNFSDDLPLAVKAYYIGLVNVLRKARYINRPSLIVSVGAVLRDPIPKEFVERVHLFNSLSRRGVVKDGFIVTQKGARLLVDYFGNKDLILDKPFTEHYSENILPTLKPNHEDEAVGYIDVPVRR